MLTDKFLKKYENKQPNWGPIGYVVYKAHYSRGNEDWHQTVARACNGLYSIGAVLDNKEYEFLYDTIFNFKGIVSGRCMWQLGTRNVRRLGGDSLINCWVTVCNSLDAFIFTANQLMLGGGVGFSILPEHVFELPKVKYAPHVVRVNSYDVDYIVPDNREGWCELLRKVLEAFFFNGKDLEYSTLCIRAKGIPLKTFGGTASGSEPLVEGITDIARILKLRLGKKLRPIDVLDIMNIIASIVKSGNKRRSAQMALGYYEDRQFIKAKDWSKGPYPNWRSNSNNSIACNTFNNLPNYFWDGYKGNGEPYGLVNLSNCREYGRLVDGKQYRTDKSIVAVNPCGEIPESNYEACNLADIYLPNIDNEQEFLDVAKILYKVCKTVTNLKYLHPQTEKIVKKNRRIGIGITGFVQATHLHDPDIYNYVYKGLEQEDIDYSKQLGINTSVRLTTVKPSGTVTLLAADPNKLGIGPGANPPYSEYCWRRLRFQANEPIVDICKKSGYEIESEIKTDGSYNTDITVVKFPVRYPGNIQTEQNINAIEQLERQKWLQTYWADNAVSITVYYKPEELDDIKDWLNNHYNSSVKTVSFLLYSGHGFTQAPFEPISEKEYQKYKQKVKPITSLHDVELLDTLECEGGSCAAK